MKLSKPKRRKEAMCGRRRSVEDDRISRLPDELIHEILSFISIHDAITTSFLSRRWTYLWTSMPYLNFSNPRYGYSNFVDKVLSRLNNQMQVSSFNLIDHSRLRPDFVKRIVNYAASHNVQQLSIDSRTMFPVTLELPALTTLHLRLITLSYKHDHKCIGLISKCTNLKNLTLTEFKVEGRTKVANIFHPQLWTLTIKYTLSEVDVFNVVTPQLKNLTIRYRTYAKYMISAPQLTSLVLTGWLPMNFSTEGFPFLEKVELIIAQPDLTMAHKIVCLLQQLHRFKFLILNLELFELLSSSTELISRQSCEFPNLKISKFLPIQGGRVYMEAQEKVATMTTELKSQDTSPSAIFTVVSCEEIGVMRKLVAAKTFIVTLGYSVGSCKRKRGKVRVKKQCSQSEFEMQWHFGEMMAQIEQEEIDGLLTKYFPVLETSDMIYSLQCIAGLLTELPASNRSVLQVAFTSLCEEAAILMNNYVMYGVKN